MISIGEADKLMRDAVTAERQRIVKELVGGDHLMGDKLYKHRKPTHGNCCTCQTCGHDHDSCVCSHNAILRIVNPDAETGT